MTSFQITLSPKRRAAARFVANVRRTLLRALAQEGRASGVTQSEVARRLEVHRSVVSRELRGQKDIGLGRIGEFAWALGLEPHLELRKVGTGTGQNSHIELPDGPAPMKTAVDLNARLSNASLAN